MKKEKNNKNKVIISSLAGVMMIVISLLGIYFVNHEERTDEVKNMK